MTGGEHAEVIRAAIRAAREDGFILGFETYELESIWVQLLLWQNRRGEDGVMRRVFEEEIDSGLT